MKEDILEQLVEDYLISERYFTMANVKYGIGHQTDSDIDVIGFAPTSPNRPILVVTCKSWQSGFNIDKWEQSISSRNRNGNMDCMKMRELADPQWAAALGATVQSLTGQKGFIHVTAVTKAIGGNNGDWTPGFKQKVRNDFISYGYRVEAEILSVSDILSALYSRITSRLEPSLVGRLIQVIKASGWKGIC